MGYPTLRLRGHYLAMATLAIGLIAYEVAVQWGSVTQGYMGISGIPPLGIGGWTVTSDRALLVLLILFAALAVLAAAGIRRSRLGRAFVAIAGSEDAARALGIDVAHYKLIAFLISAFYAALADRCSCTPSASSARKSMDCTWSCWLSPCSMSAASAQWPARRSARWSCSVARDHSALSEYQDLAYGAVLILILIYAPGGLASLSRLWSPKRRTEGA